MTLGVPFPFCELKVYSFYKMDIIISHIYYVTLLHWLGSCKIVFWSRGQNVKSELESPLLIKTNYSFVSDYQVLAAVALGSVPERLGSVAAARWRAGSQSPHQGSSQHSRHCKVDPSPPDRQGSLPTFHLLAISPYEKVT